MTTDTLPPCDSCGHGNEHQGWKPVPRKDDYRERCSANGCYCKKQVYLETLLRIAEEKNAKLQKQIEWWETRTASDLQEIAVAKKVFG